VIGFPFGFTQPSIQSLPVKEDEEAGA